MSGTFHARIPTLTDAELLRYLHSFHEYRAEAVEAALAELDRRGLALPDETRNRIHAGLAQRTAVVQARRKHSFVTSLGTTLEARLTRIRQITGGLLAAGLGAAAAIYLLAAPAGGNPLGYEPEDTKKYLRDLEMFGGKMNILATGFSRWWGSLWHGRSLAYTVAWLTAFLAFAFWFIATRRARDLAALDGGTERKA